MRSHTKYLTFHTKRRRELVRMVFCAEFDGRRPKRVVPKALGE